jgi:hypothetical protein
VEPENKLTIFGIGKIMSFINNAGFKSGVSSLIVLEEKIKNFYVGMMFDRENPFYDSINELILYLMSGGFIDYWTKNNLNQRKMFKLNEKVGPQVLTMSHLGIGFLICLIPLVLSLIMFLFEICMNSYRKRRKNAMN